MKFGQLKEHIMGSIFLEKSCKEMIKKLFADPFLKN